MHASAAAILLLTGLTGPQTAEELLPLPRKVPGMEEPLHAPRPLLPPLGFYRPDPYEVWQRYGIDRSGNWRPRVVNTPVGAFYLYSGEPYNFTYVKTGNHVP